MTATTNDRDGHVILAGAPIVLPEDADPVEHLAASELARYLYVLSGSTSALADRIPEQGTALILQRAQAPGAPALDAGIDIEQLGDQGYAIHAGSRDGNCCVTITAATARGILYGAYGLLEKLGVGFYLGGDTFPDEKVSAALAHDFRTIQQPAFAVRGNLIHDNALIGITTWGLKDYQFYFNQLAHMRCNTFVAMCYCDQSGEVWDEHDGRFLGYQPLMSSLTGPWRAIDALRTSQFSFGTADYFDEEIFSRPAVERTDDPIAQRKEAGRVLAEATRYAARFGIGVAAGFEAPVGDVNQPADPTDTSVVERLKERIRRYLARNPHLTYFVLLNHESGGCSGTKPPPAGTSADKLLSAQRDQFEHLGNPRRVWEAIRYCRFAEIAHDLLQQIAPHVKLLLAGWGGDRWMRLADYYLAFDKILPPDVIFTCFDNIEAYVAPTVSAAWGQLSPNRQRWAVPWVECDYSDFWSPQPNVESLKNLCPDALRKGCQGLLTMHWRTRDMEEEAGYAARFAWDTKLTPESFFDRMAGDAFGTDHGEAMAGHLLELQRLGQRWTGVRSPAEIAEMIFTAWDPPAPLELDADAVRFLLPFAENALTALGEQDSAQGAYEGAMFDQLEESTQPAASPADQSQLGVSEFQQAVDCLSRLATEAEPDRLRREFVDMHEEIYGVREKLIHRGMTPAQFSAVDLFLLRINHLFRNVGFQSRKETLQRIRADLAERRDRLESEGRLGRLERLDYLAANMDFVVHHDRAALLLKRGGQIEAAIEEAQQLRAAGKADEAIAVAVRAYETLVAAGMRDAALALTRKLTTRCEFAILATVNIKPLAAYWQVIEKLTAFMPVRPSRGARTRVHQDQVHIWWPVPDTVQRDAGFLVYRSSDSGEKIRLTDRPLPADAGMFLDRPGEAGHYLYSVTTIDASGWETPHSHPAEITFGTGSPGPRIVACQPPSVVEAGQPMGVRVVAVGDRLVKKVELNYRSGPDNRWKTLPMLCRFQNSFHTQVPTDQIDSGFFEFFVTATDDTGTTAHWPAAAPQGRPWTASVARSFPAEG